MADQTEADSPLVLIIDSEEAVRDLYSKWFISLGFQVMCAVGTLGLSCALWRDRPQLIITELHAKDLTLHGLFARLCSEDSTRCIPVIVLTTCCEDGILDEAKRLAQQRSWQSSPLSTRCGTGLMRSAQKQRRCVLACPWSAQMGTSDR